MNLDPVEREVEAALAGLGPVAPAIDRDRLMFEAGRREATKSTRNKLTGWRVMSGALAAGLLVSVSLHSLNWQETEQSSSPNRMVAATQQSQPPEPVPTATPDSAILVLTGNDGFPPQTALPAASYGAMRRKWEAGDEAWLGVRRPVPGVNPRHRDSSAAWGARAGLIGPDELDPVGGRL